MTALSRVRWSPSPGRTVTVSLASLSRSRLSPLRVFTEDFSASALADPTPSQARFALGYDPSPSSLAHSLPRLSLDARGEYVVTAEGLTPVRDTPSSAVLTSTGSLTEYSLCFSGHAGLATLDFIDPDGARFSLKLYVRASHLEEPHELARMVDDLASVSVATSAGDSLTWLWARADASRPPARFNRDWILSRVLSDGSLAGALAAIDLAPIKGLVRARDGVAEGLDIAENRAARAAFEQLRDVAVGDVELCTRLEALLCDCHTLATVAPSRITHDGLALRSRAGYRELLSIRDTVLGGATVELTGDGLLPLLDVATLYEHWCALALTNAVGVTHSVLSLLRGATVQASLGSRSIAMRYQPIEQSWSLGFRPDFTLEHRGELLLLDAKFRRDPDTHRLPREELLAMHAYRDAIHSAWGAWALYPGDASESWRSPDGGGVGALSLKPSVHSSGREAHTAALRSLIDMFLNRSPTTH